MADRLLFVGDAADVERLANQHHLLYGNQYVYGPHTDIKGSPLCGLLWADLRVNFLKAGLTAKQREAVEGALKLQPVTEIAQQMGIARQTCEEYIRVAIAKLNDLPPGDLGLWTVLFEETGDWAEVMHRIAEVQEKIENRRRNSKRRQNTDI